MAASGENLTEIYVTFCAENNITTNPYIVEVLQNTPVTENFTLKLPGNNRLNPVQRLDDKDALVLSKCLRNNRSLAGLHLSYNNITDEGAAHLSDLLQEGNSALRTLDLTFNDIETDGAEILCKSLRSNSSLLSLRLSGNKIGNRGATYLAAILQVNATLQDLHLDDCDLVNAAQSVIALANVLKSNRTVRSVDISRPLLFSLQEEWAVHWAQMLAVNRGLVELHLGKTGLTDTGMERLAEGLRLNHSLRYLDLRCNRVTRDGVRPLAETLKHNPTLEVVDLSSNRLEDEGVVCLSEAVACAGCGLRQLSVCSNGIGTEGLLALGQALRANASMSHVYVWGNRLEQEVCEAFRDLMSCGRLAPEQTDVSAYEVDGRVFLAQVDNTLTRRKPGADDPNTNPASTPPQNMEEEQM